MSKSVNYKIENKADVVRLFPEIERMVLRAVTAGAVVVTLGRAIRSLSQNAKLWPMLLDVSNHCDLCVNGEVIKGSKEDWKDVFSAALMKENRIAIGLDGGIVFLGMRTSKLTKARFAELIELIYAYGSERGVQWSEKAHESYEKYREAE